MTVDRDRIQRFLTALRGNVEKLQLLSEQSVSEFSSDFRSHHAAMRLLQISIEDMINIGNHVISRRSYRKPNDLADVFRVLAENEIVSGQECERLERAARFRNRLVHVYWDIDLKEVHRFLSEDLGDFDVFADRIGRLLLDEVGGF